MKLVSRATRRVVTEDEVTAKLRKALRAEPEEWVPILEEALNQGHSIRRLLADPNLSDQFKLILHWVHGRYSIS